MLDADKTRVLRMPPFVFTKLLEHQAVGVPAAELRLRATQDVWAFPAEVATPGQVGTPNVPSPHMAKRKKQVAVPKKPARSLKNSIGMELKLIPTGEFYMGSPHTDPKTLSDEEPRHRVSITQPFLLGVYPITQGEYESLIGTNPSQFQGPDRLPVEQVSWLDAVNFCNKLSQKEGLEEYYQNNGNRVTVPDFRGSGYRLPMEAEWEYSCRAGSTTRYSFGDDAARLNQYAWYSDNAGEQTQAVGGKAPNAFGLYDLHGNVWEWCGDWYDYDYYKGLPSQVDDPIGPSLANCRVVRGGCWNHDPSLARSAKRYGLMPDYQFNFVGFRVARVP